MSSAYKDNFNSSFLVCLPLFLFLCFIALARTSCTVWNKSDENRYHCLFPDLRGKSFSLSSLRMMLAVGFFIDALFQIEEVSFYSSSFFHKFLFIYSFIFGCFGSSLLCAGFLWLWQVGTTLCCGTWASHCSSFFCCGARALGTRDSVVAAHGLSCCGAWAQ